ncbi:hypothetical protein ACFL1H_07155, partial [Nanoarchaeota archaeon]
KNLKRMITFIIRMIKKIIISMFILFLLFIIGCNSGIPTQKLIYEQITLEVKGEIENETMLFDLIENRLNNLGLYDISIKKLTDETKSYYKVRYGYTEYNSKIQELFTGQGKFEAKIGNKTVFTNNRDIVYVCKTSECSGIRDCQKSYDTGEYFCNYQFQIKLSEDAAQRFAEISDELEITDNYLSEDICFYLDDRQLECLKIDDGLKGIPQQNIQITGSSSGSSEEEAFQNADKEISHLQTILITGSINYDMEIVSTEVYYPLK